jgi:hypothetical protein
MDNGAGRAEHEGIATRSVHVYDDDGAVFSGGSELWKASKAQKISKAVESADMRKECIVLLR